MVYGLWALMVYEGVVKAIVIINENKLVETMKMEV